MGETDPNIKNWVMAVSGSSIFLFVSSTAYILFSLLLF